MPTVLVVDVSLSLAHALQGELLESYKEFIQEGLLYLLKDLETNHPLELISFITFSSNGKVVVPFTRNFTALKNALFNIKLEDKTIVTAGMKTAISHIINTFGTTTPVQIILVTNGCKLGGEPELLTLDIPFPTKIHIIAYPLKLACYLVKGKFVNPNIELRIFSTFVIYGEKSRIDVSLLSTLARKTKGFFHFLELPQAASLARQAFASLIESNYVPYQGVLACGHLMAPMTLHPNPTLLSFSSQLRIATFPSAVSPTVLCPFIFDEAIYIKGFDLRRHPLPVSPLSSHTYPPLLLVLHDVLRTERLTAVARIDEQTPNSKEWFCLINSVPADPTPSGPTTSSTKLQVTNALVLSVLSVESGVALGLHDLLAVPANASAPSAHLGTQVSQMMQAFAGRSQNTKSYNTPVVGRDTTLAGVTSDTLLPECSKIIKYAKTRRIDLLYMQCEKIRQTAVTFSCSDLLPGIAQMLIEEQRGSAEMDSFEVNELIKILQTHPIDVPIVYREKPPSLHPPAPPSASMSINSLINS